MELSGEQQAEIDAARAAALRAIDEAGDEQALEAARVEHLGKSGRISLLRRNIGQLPPEQKKPFGEAVNAAIESVEGALTHRSEALAAAKLEAELSGSPLDVTLPGRPVRQGRRHPLSQTMEDLVSILGRMGFSVASGPEVELDYYNFEALNFPKNHPARDMQDTFFVDDGVLPPGSVPPGELLLRTHTSPVQVRTMLEKQPPIRIIAPGRVYRCDSDQTHSPMFHQIEGLYVARGVTFAELKGTLDELVRTFFGREVRTRFRPSFFPFTEPSAEVDISCVICGGTGRARGTHDLHLAVPAPDPLRPSRSVGEPAVPPHGGDPCRVCKATGWLEVLGAGMVHPKVFESVGYDPRTVSGFAFGMGVERIAMLRYGIDDLRLLFENDVRFLAQF
ncbi:phenylalanine--tRNA ligase subunit alpha [Vulgatibacter incomptus]|uniref:Phenylalanine--tRNA ligase alpha subunit n=1 Tax=Vulgatibacter incomptus TaxID=1391653 RepID=A0A0K1PAG9_9BACT|nr:phenylalanine--tRNA ligase subunit alpha [Vulgatibacter incomptus]AKU90533.1 Phenylalanyl-tRNA synthetase alpha chain [Vulgatibacter incomptus]